MELSMEKMMQFFIIILIVGLIIYIITSIFLNKLNKLMYGKGTPMAWIPIFNIYLLGKLTVNKLVGWILIVCIFITGSYSTTVNGVETTHDILPKGINSVVSTIYYISVTGLFIYAIVKYIKLKKEKSTSVNNAGSEAKEQIVTPTVIQGETSQNTQMTEGPKI